MKFFKSIILLGFAITMLVSPTISNGTEVLSHPTTFKITSNMSFDQKVRIRKNLAEIFYINAGGKYQNDTIRRNHMGAIDFTKGVMKRKLIKGTELIQWRRKGEAYGDYYTLPGQDPGKLGVPSDYTQAYRVILDKDYYVLQSISKTVEAWDGSGSKYLGGAIQIFNSDIKNNATFTLIQK